MAKFAGLRDPVTMDFENSTIAYCVDAFTISMGALMGSSPVTAFVESATGISEGGKTGITAMVTGFMFFISIFFAPIFASIPPWATGGALVIVGSLMIRNVREINWDYVGDSVPAFLTLIMIPLTYNIAYGVIAGIGTYVILNGIPWLIRKASGGRIIPPLYDLGEQWKVPPGGFVPRWMRNVAAGRWKVWEDDPAAVHALHPQMQMYSSKTQLNSFTSQGSTAAPNSPNSPTTNILVNGRNIGPGGVILGNEPTAALPRLHQHQHLQQQHHHTTLVVEEDQYEPPSPGYEKDGLRPESGETRVESPTAVAYPPRKFA